MAAAVHTREEVQARQAREHCLYRVGTNCDLLRSSGRLSGLQTASGIGY